MRIKILVLLLSASTSALAGEIDAVHSDFMKAFNDRQWDSVKTMLTEDAVFHRATGDTVYIGPEAIIERWSKTIGASDQWNVKFAKLDTTSQMTGKDGRIVERGDFAVTAGGDSSACYAGSFMMTWAPDASQDMKLQTLAWQDVETDISTCK